MRPAREDGQGRAGTGGAGRAQACGRLTRPRVGTGPGRAASARRGATGSRGSGSALRLERAGDSSGSSAPRVEPGEGWRSPPGHKLGTVPLTRPAWGLALSCHVGADERAPDPQTSLPGGTLTVRAPVCKVTSHPGSVVGMLMGFPLQRLQPGQVRPKGLLSTAPGTTSSETDTVNKVAQGASLFPLSLAHSCP